MAKHNKWTKWKASAAGILAAGLALQWVKSTAAFDTAQQAAAAGATSSTPAQNDSSSDTAINDWDRGFENNNQDSGARFHGGHHRGGDFGSGSSDSGLGGSDSGLSGSDSSTDNGDSGSSSQGSTPSSNFETHSGGS
ncbi:hypothetical protein [Paenibacillus tuaregi]|uniref:hypothetical protein n=1 Tax=Paenibacillus tuaregi TaxID=1816681 RepID=UPI000837C5FA|nr:hypothetical protein [Paenibacillus tuaregi]